ncbi:signal peptidase [Aureococcus anophagefferens]|nr:signal peptidase [Aureococcus anophagefferens]
MAAALPQLVLAVAAFLAPAGAFQTPSRSLRRVAPAPLRRGPAWPLGADGNNGGDAKGGGFRGWLDGFGEDEELLEDVRVYAQTLAICLLIRFFLVEPRFIPSLSMYPTFDVGDQLAVEKVSKRYRPLVKKDPYPIHRNEVIVFNPPPAFKALVSSRARDEALIKRVVAVAGDEVAVRSGVLYVNGKAQAEDDVINERPFYDMEPRRAAGNVFVLGDNQTADGHIGAASRRRHHRPRRLQVLAAEPPRRRRRARRELLGPARGAWT